MKIHAACELTMQEYECPDDHIVISISTPGRLAQPVINDSATRKALLRLEFDDVDSPDTKVSDERATVPFTKEIAQTIRQFVKQNPASTIICHCEAGACRSPGVAAALSKAINHDDAFFFKRYRPNMLVFRIMLETMLGPDGIEDLIQDKLRERAELDSMINADLLF